MKRFLAIMVVGVLFVGMFFLSKTNLHLVMQTAGVGVDKFVVCGDCQVAELSSSDYSSIINILNLEIVDSNDIAGRKIVEGYSNKLKNYVVIGNRKINVQISITDDKMIVGYPLIEGSF